jgi:hypothetical protein
MSRTVSQHETSDVRLFAVMQDGSESPVFYVRSAGKLLPAVDVIPADGDHRACARELATRHTKPSPLGIASRLGMDYFLVEVPHGSTEEPLTAWRVDSKIYFDRREVGARSTPASGQIPRAENGARHSSWRAWIRTTEQPRSRWAAHGS